MAYSTGVFACQQAANWQGLFKGMGSWCRVFSLEKIRKKRWITDSTSSTLPTYLNLPQLAQLIQLLNLLSKKCYEISSVSEVTSFQYLGLGSFRWEGYALREKKDVQAILQQFFLCLLVLGGVSPLFILLPSWDDEICG